MSNIQVDIKNYNPSITTTTNWNMSRQSIINGNFDIWQRATSFTNPADTAYTTDRFMTLSTNTGTLPTTITHSRQILTSGDIAKSYYHYRIAPNGAGSGFGASDLYGLSQRIEFGTRYLCGLNRKVTLSFYARSSIPNKKLGVCLNQTYGTTGSPSSSEIINGTKWTLTSSWTPYTYTFTTNTLVGKTFGTSDNDYLSVRFLIMWGTSTATTVGDTVGETFVGSGNIDIAQVQLCAGDTALPFEPYSRPLELEKCMRYCQVITTAVSEESIAMGMARDTVSGRHYLYLPIEMRIVPAITVTASDWELNDFENAPIDCTAVTLGAESRRGMLHINTTVASGLTQYRPYALCADTTIGRIFIVSAEL